MTIAGSNQAEARTFRLSPGIISQREIVLCRHARHIHRGRLKRVLQLATTRPVIQCGIGKQLASLRIARFEKCSDGLQNLLLALRRFRVLTTRLCDHCHLLTAGCKIPGRLRTVERTCGGHADTLKILEHLRVAVTGVDLQQVLVALIVLIHLVAKIGSQRIGGTPGQPVRNHHAVKAPLVQLAVEVLRRQRPPDNRPATRSMAHRQGRQAFRLTRLCSGPCPRHPGHRP